MSNDPLRIFIGFDPREAEAYEVASFSLQRRASIPVECVPISQADARSRGLYWRERDPLAATEFTYTRFLTPALAGYRGLALFCDCDFLWLADVAELVRHADERKAVYCVQHDHRPPEKTKMDGVAQTQYPRKNWSSLMLFDCDHPAVRGLTAEVVNTGSPAYLHRLQWAADTDIGALPMEWNWLEGWSEKPSTGTPKAVHFTRGGPWFEQWRHVDFADLWIAEREAMNRAGIARARLTGARNGA